MRKSNLRIGLILVGLIAATFIALRGASMFVRADLRPVEPALISLMRSGWTPTDPLDETVTPLGPRMCSGRRVVCSSVEFTSQVWHGETERIFGFYAAPADVVASGTKAPALLMVHGGGGHAVVGQVMEAAS